MMLKETGSSLYDHRHLAKRKLLRCRTESKFGYQTPSFFFGCPPSNLLFPIPATHTEGIFRVSGSNKRINQLQVVFDEPPRYGKDFDWTGYSVHDAASVLRRYLNSLPVRSHLPQLLSATPPSRRRVDAFVVPHLQEPVIPAGLYLDFTAVLR